MFRFRWLHLLQKLVDGRSFIHTLFDAECSLSGRENVKAGRIAALSGWRQPCAVGHRVGLGKRNLVRTCLKAPLCRGRSAPGAPPGQPPVSGGMAKNGSDRKPFAMNAFARSTKKDPASVISRKALGDGP